jgi:hypothetical protein
MGGAFSVTGTIGQPDAANAMTGGHFSLTAGFWSVIIEIQTTGGPTLYISYSNNKVTVSWEAQDGWVLQENSDLTAPTAWTNSSRVTTLNGVSFHSIDNPADALFFRLKRDR